MDAQETGRTTRPWRALRRWLIGGGIVLGGATLIVGGALAAVVAVFARKVVVPPRSRREEVRILAVDPAAARIVLSADPDTVVDGQYGLWFGADSGHCRVGEILDRTEATVTRRLLRTDFGELTGATQGRWSGWFHLGPWEFELPYENVTVATPVGPAPAWWVPAAGASSRWVIQVHGRAVQRQECLRAVPVFHEAGMHSLIVSYRNDGEAPESRDGRYGLGDTEWQDISAALRFARDHGASDVVLMGWSMGGAIAMQTALRAEERAVLRGVVLESPAVDWHDILHFHGAGYGLPRAINNAAIQTIASPWGRAVTGLDQAIDFDRLDIAGRAADVTLPILLMHSVDDGYVPIAGSRELAAARPDIVTFVEFERARHTKLWNYDPGRWNNAIRDWLDGL